MGKIIDSEALIVGQKNWSNFLFLSFLEKECNGAGLLRIQVVDYFCDIASIMYCRSIKTSFL